MKTIIARKFRFEAAHQLPNYPGKCANLHGHSWEVEVAVSGPVYQESGFVIDFSALRDFMQPILDNFDHHLLNNIISNPTAEAIAAYVWDWLRKHLEPETQGVLKIEWVKVWESPDSFAEVII